jgi:hypothetical protein
MKFDIDFFTKSWYGKGESHNGFWCANLKEKNHLQVQGVEGIDLFYFKLFLNCSLKAHEVIAIIIVIITISARRDSAVGKATCYGLDSLEIDSRSGRYLPHPTRVALEPTSGL